MFYLIFASLSRSSLQLGHDWETTHFCIKLHYQFHLNCSGESIIQEWTRKIGEKISHNFWIEAYVCEATNKTYGILKTCLNLCFQWWLKSSLDIVTNLAPLRSWHWKLSFAGVLINVKLLFLFMVKVVAFRRNGFSQNVIIEKFTLKTFEKALSAGL